MIIVRKEVMIIVITRKGEVIKVIGSVMKDTSRTGEEALKNHQGCGKVGET